MQPALLSVTVASTALVISYLAFGLPNHPYQPGIAIAILLVAYHRRWLKRPADALGYVLAALNAGILSLLGKLIIGGGVRMPFAWLKLPGLQGGSPGWIALPQLVWQPIPLSDWPVDLTRIQSFLFVVTAAAAWVRFQPFASLTAFALLLASLPAYVDFRWDWVLPAMGSAFAAFYVQAPASAPNRRAA